jgi:hypothetical protein
MAKVRAVINRPRRRSLARFADLLESPLRAAL